MAIGQDLGARLLRNIAPIARTLEREDRTAFLDLVCEFQATAPDQRAAFSERFEPYLGLVQALRPSDLRRPGDKEIASQHEHRRCRS